MAVNKIIIIGNVGANPTLHKFENSERWAIQFPVAVTERWKDVKGAEKEQTTWFNCVRYTKTENLARFIQKGNRIYVEGKVDVSAYLKNGEPVGKLNILVSNIDFLTSKQDGVHTPPNPNDLPPTTNQDDDDLPF